MWLYTGLKVPSNLSSLQVMHVPLIETQAVTFDQRQAMKELKTCEAMIISSQQTVHYLKDFLKLIDPGYHVYVTGQATLEVLTKSYQGVIIKGGSSDQEGILEKILIDGVKRVFYPHAEHVRSFLLNELKKHDVVVSEVICYQTRAARKKLQIPESLSGYIFSAPSTCLAFKTLYGLPKMLPILVPGHVTEKACLDLFGSAYKPLIKTYL